MRPRGGGDIRRFSVDERRALVAIVWRIVEESLAGREDEKIRRNKLPTESEYAATYYQSFTHFGFTSRKIQEAPQAPPGGPSSAIFDFRGFCWSKLYHQCFKPTSEAPRTQWIIFSAVSTAGTSSIISEPTPTRFEVASSSIIPERSFREFLVLDIQLDLLLSPFSPLGCCCCCCCFCAGLFIRILAVLGHSVRLVRTFLCVHYTPRLGVYSCYQLDLKLSHFRSICLQAGSSRYKSRVPGSRYQA